MFHYKHIKEEPGKHQELLDREKLEPLMPFLEPEPAINTVEEVKPKKVKRAKVQKTQ